MKVQKEIVESIDVFTPTKPAYYTFVERAEINTQLVDALMIPGKQLIVYGFSGSGKTTLLRNKLDELYDCYISTSCTKGMKLDQLRRNAFDQLDKYYVDSKTHKKSNSVGASYLAMKAELSSSKETEYKRIIPIQLNDQRLAEFLGEANCCWVIEDFHKVEKSEKEELAQMMKVFMDMASTYKKVKIIAIGAVGTAKEVVEYDKEMKNRVAEIHVKLMTIDELSSIIKKGAELLNVSFPQDISNEITYYSNGLASLCHQMCLSMCFNNKIYSSSESFVRFRETDLQAAIKDYCDQNSETFKSTFDKAKKLEKGRDIKTMEIFKIFINAKNGEATFESIYKSFHYINSKSLRSILNKLTSPDYGEILRYDKDGELYFLSNPFLKLFIQLQMKQAASLEDQFSRISIKDIHAFLKAKEDLGNIIDDIDEYYRYDGSF